MAPLRFLSRLPIFRLDLCCILGHYKKIMSNDEIEQTALNLEALALQKDGYAAKWRKDDENRIIRGVEAELIAKDLENNAAFLRRCAFIVRLSKL